MESADVSETEIHESRSTSPKKKFKKLESGFLVSPPIWGSGSVEVETDQSLIEFITGHMEAQHAYRKRISSPPPPAPSGLVVNMGNNCFLNSILQCCTHTVPLLKSFGSYNRDVKCFRIEAFCVFCTLREHVEDSLKASGGVIRPSKFVDNLSNISSSFQRIEQEDAHEFLKCLLEKLDDSCCLDQNKQVLSSSSQEHSFVKKIFGSRLKIQRRCCNCGHCLDNFEAINDLSLEIEDVETLPDALRSFTKVETIADCACEKCEQKILSEKRYTLDQAPPVAIFHLKRFKNDGIDFKKISKHVKYPLELDLHPYTNGSENIDVKLKYELYAVVVHVGNISHGHYFCYIRSAPDTWHKLDDSTVKSVKECDALSQEAYILFYAREGTPWFSDFRKAQSRGMGQSSETTSSVLHDFSKFCPPPLEERTKPTGNVLERISSPLPGPPQTTTPSPLGVNGSTLSARSANDKDLEDKRRKTTRITRSMTSTFRACIPRSPDSEKSPKRKKRNVT